MIQTTKNKVTLSKLTFHKLDWLEHGTIWLSIWFFIYPKPYDILFTTLLCIPLLGLFLNGLSGRPSISSLVTISKDTDGSNNYDVADFIDVAAFFLLVRVILDFEFESLYSMILPVTIAFAIMLIILFVSHRSIARSSKNKTWIYSSLFFNVFLYSFAGTYGANCVYDNSEPTVHHVEVVNKRINTSGKGKDLYYIKVKPWGHHYDEEEINVPKSQFDEIQIGQTVKIDVKEGLFNIPWYYIE
ncbi:MAG TPA: hypothetical protein DIW47_10275 [Bacteroidetes bacterium]|nr:hypothetical protein [Bacteroidota bacterium]